MLKRIITIVLAVILAFSLFKIGQSFYGYYANRRVYSELESMYQESHRLNEEKQDTNNDDDEVDKFEKLKEINEDIVGWIKIPETKINYPVVQAEDNDYYLERNFNREWNPGGAIFMDFRNTVEDLGKNTVIYGHRMRDGSMFENLKRYKSQEFANEHRYIKLDTLYDETKWKVFSVYITDTDFNYIETDFDNDEEYQDLLDEIRRRSIIEMDIDVGVENKILTLSTCDYTFDDARLVVHATKIDSE
ncbi:class B sortase [Proteinivorax hydrogeniformans]|uniref:Class B sortase n=1 Tax=Proteinivorax hydrogeniformans TaxID=1826727 RepID=A0AAU8HSG0_9FIRM